MFLSGLADHCARVLVCLFLQKKGYIIEAKVWGSASAMPLDFEAICNEFDGYHKHGSIGECVKMFLADMVDQPDTGTCCERGQWQEEQRGFQIVC